MEKIFFIVIIMLLFTIGVIMSVKTAQVTNFRDNVVVIFILRSLFIDHIKSYIERQRNFNLTKIEPT